MKSRCRWRRRKEARPAELVSAALDLFVERGFSATKLDDVARRAGVSKGTVYLYFESKEALLEAAVKEVVLPALEALEQQEVGFQGSAADLLREMSRQWRTALQDTRLSRLPKLMVSEAANFPELAKFYVDNVVKRARRLSIRVLERGIANGEFRPMDTEYVAQVGQGGMVFAAIYERSLALYDDPAFESDRFLDTHIEIFLRGIAADPKE